MTRKHKTPVCLVLVEHKGMPGIVGGREISSLSSAEHEQTEQLQRKTALRQLIEVCSMFVGGI